ncbi:tryptophan halogenase family protein [Arenicella xantha]|uniref:Tryptophan halogenase n=1 Tax=Arenicella xantha TaxID=644221 RepID=A0A395JG77_9GAMM|nr:tryptophan halogenase family protein [Arenicella xantha]RBP48731.1 tryptophan halogenase [Arenicella xantha]
MEHKKINKVIVAGGGTAGWMAAASLAKLLGKTLDISLIESDDIPTVGVGEATIPTMLTLHELLGINEREFVAEVNGTFKLGISFENWRDVDQDYIHSFGFTGKDCWAAGFQHFWLKGQQLGIAKDFGEYCGELIAARQNKFAVTPKNGLNYAYHIDAGRYAAYLRKLAEQHGAKRIEGKIVEVGLNSDSGDIESLTLASGQVVEGDLFIDCSGFRGLLIEQALHTGYDDWSHWLPCDSAIAVQTESLAAPIPYTRSIARGAGWQWRIPLQSRVGNGLVFCSRYLSDDDAKQLLLDNLEGAPINEPRVIKFRTGTRRKHWNKNCIALGLSSGFIEPLESTSIHLIQRGITRLMQMFPYDGIRKPDVAEFNAQMDAEIVNIRDFIILHYHVTNRDDTPFWRFCRAMDIPDTLRHRIELFKQTGRVFKGPNELFGENSWTQVMLGQGLLPEQYHPIVNMMSDDELSAFLRGIDQTVTNQVRQLPSHQQFIDHYCKSSAG